MNEQTTEAVAEPEPLLRVVAGNPTAEELAALVTVVAARRRAAVDVAPASSQRTAWGDARRVVRAIHHHGPGFWRRSAFPR